MSVKGEGKFKTSLDYEGWPSRSSHYEGGRQLRTSTATVRGFNQPKRLK